MNERSVKREMIRNKAEKPNSLITALLKTEEGSKLLGDYAQVVRLAGNLVEKFKEMTSKLDELTERVAEISSGYQNLVAFMSSSRLIRIEALYEFEAKMKATMEEAERLKAEMEEDMPHCAESVELLDGESCANCLSHCTACTEIEDDAHREAYFDQCEEDAHKAMVEASRGPEFLAGHPALDGKPVEESTEEFMARLKTYLVPDPRSDSDDDG